MERKAFTRGLLDYLGSSPTPFHATKNLADILRDHQFEELDEADTWVVPPGKYFVTRNESSIIAFVRGEKDPAQTGIRMSGAHTDSPCLKVKPVPETYTKDYLQLGVEVYGGVLLNPWFDRDLSLAGRVTCQIKGGAIQSFLVDFARAIATVPSLAIHLDREANSSRSVNPQTDIPPVLSQEKGKLTDLLKAQIKKQHPKSSVTKVLGYELCFYDTNPPALVGLNEDFIASARLDNLLSCYTGITSLLEADKKVSSMVICNDHEEVGSASTSGAGGTFLKDVLQRLLPDTEQRLRTIAASLLVSTDNAHGVHPNYSAKHDGNHGPILNKGPVIKVNANQRYATNSETEAYFSVVCTKQKVPFQKFINRTDLACGSTIGPITAKEIGVKTMDVGVPTFGMHSIRETAGSADAHYLHKALTAFFKDKGRLGAG